MDTSTEVWDIVVIGGGPTGINIAVESNKANLSCLIIEKGMLVNSLFHFPSNMTFFSTSKNLEIADIPFISHTDKPTRKEALEYYRRIAESYKLNLALYETVQTATKKSDGLFHITSKKKDYKAKHIVVATGFYDVPRMLGVPGEDLKKVKHYYDEAHPYLGQNVLVIGAANSACDVALETWQKGANVTMAIRGSELYEKVKYWILPNIQNRISEGSVTAHFNTRVTDIKLREVVLSTPQGDITILNDFVLAMTGYLPDYDLMERLQVPITDDEYRLPVFNEETLETSVKCLYVAGVINAGMRTSKLFIENTRHHPSLILNHILSKD
ncbi:MAG: thioredoxin reductase (NADPH) [Saprospiraceae bacterium]|jgi:thioredoxin reductase (NADPH)